MDNQEEGGKKYKIFFQNGITMILDGFIKEQAQDIAREEDEKIPVAALVEITPDQGGVHISFR